jgi:predicted ATPase
MLDEAFLREISIKRDLIASFDHYPFSIPVVGQLESLVFSPSVTFIIGENGSGKSTLIEAIAVALGFNAEGGTKNFTFGTHNNHSDLFKYLRLVRSAKRPKDGFFLRAESFYNVATNIEMLDRNEPGEVSGPPVIDSYGGISLHGQSHGESFLSLMLHRFSGNGLYILDEPEAALSPVRQLSVLSRMNQLVKKHSQFIIATHSPILLAYPGATIYQIADEGLEKVAYKDTEHYKVTRSFLENPEKMIDILFEDMDNGD